MSIEREREIRSTTPSADRTNPDAPRAEDRRDMRHVPSTEGGIAPPTGETGRTGESGIPGTTPVGGVHQVPGAAGSDVSGNSADVVGMPRTSLDTPPGGFGSAERDAALPTARMGGNATPSTPAPPMGGNQYGKSMGGMGGGAAGAVGGALIGSVIGPAGTVLGGMIGAVAGAVAGATAGAVGATAFNPNTLDEYWENNFVQRPYYVPGMTFADYRPAYHYGAERCSLHGGREYREADVRDGWDVVRGTSRLTWEQAQPAIRDAWNHRCDRMHE